MVTRIDYMLLIGYSVLQTLIPNKQQFFVRQCDQKSKNWSHVRTLHNISWFCFSWTKLISKLKIGSVQSFQNIWEMMIFLSAVQKLIFSRSNFKLRSGKLRNSTSWSFFFSETFVSPWVHTRLNICSLQYHDDDGYGQHHGSVFGEFGFISVASIFMATATVQWKVVKPGFP